MTYRCWIALLILLQGIGGLMAQESSFTDDIEVHGNIDIYGQTYNRDSLIGAPIVAAKSGLNTFTNLIATKGNLSAGLRLETYLPQIQGFDPRYGNKPAGISYRFIRYANEKLDVTVGNYYEQFGMGMVLRAYEERALGLDNMLNGVRVILSPIKGLRIKGLVGNQRYYWQYSDGYIRAFDTELSLNEAIPSLYDKPLRLIFGGSFVSKFQPQTISNLEFPENVAAMAGRTQLNYKDFGLTAEYVCKMNDPSADNHFIYKPGQGLFVSATYSTKGLGINVSAKSIDNMSFRSGRDAILNDQLIAYLPALTRQHTYNLAGTLYPYATQLVGEIGIQGDVIYKIKKETALGGPYGTTIQVNSALINGHNINRISSFDSLDRYVYLYGDPHRLGYSTSLFSIGKGLKNHYFRDVNIEIERKFSKLFKLKTTYAYFEYNIDLIQGKTYGRNVYAHVGVIETLFKVTKKHSIRSELQHLYTQQDHGNWAFALVEYGYSPHWFLTVLDQYNYGNHDPQLRLHYPTAQVVYIEGANRISIGYGRQRAGIFCVGGVCRNVPAANGLSVAITSSF